MILLAHQLNGPKKTFQRVCYDHGEINTLYFKQSAIKCNLGTFPMRRVNLRIGVKVSVVDGLDQLLSDFDDLLLAC